MEIDLLIDYPKIKRDTSQRSTDKTLPNLVSIAKKYDWEYFDRKLPRVCYGGYVYDGRWQPVVKTFVDHYKLIDGAKILDIGCAKGYMLYDFLQFNSTFKVFGIDISRYAVNCCPQEVTACVGNAKDLSMFCTKEFDLVVSINTIHNLPEEECRQAIREIQRIGKNAYIVVDAYSNEDEKRRMFDWNVTAETILSTEEWRQVFKEEHYTGDYFWFKP